MRSSTKFLLWKKIAFQDERWFLNEAYLGQQSWTKRTASIGFWRGSWRSARIGSTRHHGACADIKNLGKKVSADTSK